MCSNPPVSSFGQQQREHRLRHVQDKNYMEYHPPDRRSELPATGDNKIETAKWMVLSGPGNDHQNIGASPPAGVSSIRSCQVSQSDLGNLCVVAAQTWISAVQTIFQNGMSDKGASIEEHDWDSQIGNRASKASFHIVH